MSKNSSPRKLGVGQVLVVVYAILAIAATGRSAFQLITKFDVAPVAYVLSGVAAVVYIVATVALARSESGGWMLALACVSFEFAGVLVVGVLSIVNPVLFPADTVWSSFGQGYGFVPLILPILGLVFLFRRRDAMRRDGVHGTATRREVS